MHTKMQFLVAVPCKWLVVQKLMDCPAREVLREEKRRKPGNSLSVLHRNPSKTATIRGKLE